MNPTDLSVSELAQMTGLAINSAWDCATTSKGDARIAVWSAPGWRAKDLLSAAPSSLPAANALRVEWRTGSAFWDVELPLSLDIHWLREITTGFPLGVRPVRARPECGVPATVRLQGGFVSVVWRNASKRARVQVVRPAGETWSVTVD
jgi:hypothetical protein